MAWPPLGPGSGACGLWWQVSLYASHPLKQSMSPDLAVGQGDVAGATGGLGSYWLPRLSWEPTCTGPRAGRQDRNMVTPSLPSREPVPGCVTQHTPWLQLPGPVGLCAPLHHAQGGDSHVSGPSVTPNAPGEAAGTPRPHRGQSTHGLAVGGLPVHVGAGRPQVVPVAALVVGDERRHLPVNLLVGQEDPFHPSDLGKCRKDCEGLWPLSKAHTATVPPQPAQPELLLGVSQAWGKASRPGLQEAGSLSSKAWTSCSQDQLTTRR